MSDDNIVTFDGNRGKGNQPQPEEQEEFILICTLCDNKTFNLYAGGKIKCGFCDVEVVSADPRDHEAWRRVVGEVDPDTKEDIKDEGYDVKTTTQRHQMSTPGFARRKTMKLLADWEKDNKLVMLVGYNAAGEGRHWFNITNEPQREWVIEKFNMLFDTLKKMDITSAVSEIIHLRPDTDMPSDEDES